MGNYLKVESGRFGHRGAAELVSLDPSTGEELWRGMLPRQSDIDSAVANGRSAFRSWSAEPLERRERTAHRFCEIVEERQDAFARLISRETGKPYWESKTEIASVRAKVALSIRAYQERTGERTSETAGVRHRLHHRPHGLLLVLGAFNFPAHLPNGHIVPAILAGNAVILKPSEHTPAVAEFMADCWREAGLPHGVLQIIHGGGAVGAAVADREEVAGILFTGSSRTGLALAQRFGPDPTKILALEMGGNNPIVAWDLGRDQIEAAAAIIVQSAYQTAGQRCTCARRLIIGEQDVEALLDAVGGLIDRIIVGQPFEDPQPFMGPVICNEAADQLVEAFETLEEQGGRVLRPLTRIERQRPFLRPGLIDVTDVALRTDEEQFGPFLQVIRVATFEAAVAEANDTRFGLAASLLTPDRRLYDLFLSRTRAGVTNWNRPTGGASSEMPFGGTGLSGNHRPSAYYAADYCAWPVASLEAERPEFRLATGIRGQ